MPAAVRLACAHLLLDSKAYRYQMLSMLMCSSLQRDKPGMLINMLDSLRAAVSTVLAQGGTSASGSGTSAAERALASFLGSGMSGALLGVMQARLEAGQVGGWVQSLWC